MAHGCSPAGNGDVVNDDGGDALPQEPCSVPLGRRARRSVRLTPHQLKRAQELMFEQRKVLEVEWVARGLNMSPGLFAKAFKNTVGIPPYGWHLRQRVARSASLLHDNALTLAQIAIECGFSDQSHYTKAFRRLLGITPGKWRRQLKKNIVRVEALISLN